MDMIHSTGTFAISFVNCQLVKRNLLNPTTFPIGPSEAEEYFPGRNSCDEIIHARCQSFPH